MSQDVSVFKCSKCNKVYKYVPFSMGSKLTQEVLRQLHECKDA